MQLDLTREHTVTFNILRKNDFAFVDLRTADSRIDWNKAPVIEL